MRSPSTTLRILRLLFHLQQRDSEGHPQPALLSDLRLLYQTEGGSATAAARRLERDLRVIGEVYAIRRQGEGSGKGGRAPAELLRIWALLPGEDV